MHTSLFPLVYISSVYNFNFSSVLALWCILSQSHFTKSSADIHFSTTIMNPCAKAARLAPCNHPTPRFDIGLPFGHLSMDGLHAVRAKYKADDEKPDSMNDGTLFFSKLSSSHRFSFEDAWAKFVSQYSKIRIGVDRTLQNHHFNIWRLLCPFNVFSPLNKVRVESSKYFQLKVTSATHVSQDNHDGMTIAPGVAILTPRIDVGSHFSKGQATDGVAELKSTYPDGLEAITAIGLHSRGYLSRKNLPG
jgi:hypothetical protein